ncbi:MAG: hypothetical protein U0414_00150 [Polyangiaceae bacterium]
MRPLLLSSVVLPVLLVLGCDASESARPPLVPTGGALAQADGSPTVVAPPSAPPPSAPVSATPAPKSSTDPAAPARPPATIVEEVHGKLAFTVNVTSPPTAPVGAEVTAHLTITLSSGYVFVPAAAPKIKLAPTPGVTLASGLIRAAEAEKSSPTEMTFAIKLTLTEGGLHEVPGELRFGLNGPQDSIGPHPVKFVILADADAPRP